MERATSACARASVVTRANANARAGTDPQGRVTPSMGQTPRGHRVMLASHLSQRSMAGTRDTKDRAGPGTRRLSQRPVALALDPPALSKPQVEPSLDASRALRVKVLEYPLDKADEAIRALLEGNDLVAIERTARDYALSKLLLARRSRDLSSCTGIFGCPCWIC